MGEVLYPCFNDSDISASKVLASGKREILSQSNFFPQYILAQKGSFRHAYEILEPVKLEFEKCYDEQLDFDIYSIAVEELILEIRLYLLAITSFRPDLAQKALEKQNILNFRKRALNILEKEFLQ